MKSVFLALIFALLLPWSSAESQQGFRIEKLTYGEYTIGDIKEYDDPKSPTGKRFAGSNEKLISQTNIITLRHDINFGFEFLLSGPSETVELEVLYFLPNDSGRASTTDEPAYRRTSLRRRGIRDRVFWYTGDTAAAAETMRLGEYIFQILHQGRVLVEHRFNLVR